MTSFPCTLANIKRLGEHFIGENTLGRQRTGSKASASIKQYYKKLLPELQEQILKISEDMKYPLKGLYFTCTPISDPASFESFVRLENFHYPWNRRDEKIAAGRAESTKSTDYEYIYTRKATRFIGG